MEVSRRIFVSIDGVEQFPSVTETRTASGLNYQKTGVLVTQSGEVTYSIPTGIGNARELVIVNKDDTNYLSWGVATGVRPFLIYPGGRATVDLTPTESAIFLQADTADVSADVLVIES